MSTEDTPPATDGGENPTNTPTTTGRRGHRPLVVASMAAAVLLAGGGAAYWSSTASEGGRTGAGTQGDPPPLALEGYEKSPSRDGIAQGEPNPQGATYRATGELPDGPDSAPVYRPRGQVTEQTVAALAKALDVTGKVRSAGSTWKVGGPGEDRHEPVLEVAKAGTGSWTFSQYGTPGGVACTLPTEPEGERGDTPDGTGSAPAGCPSYRGQDATTEDDGSGRGAISPEKAKEAAKPVLKVLGQEDARLNAEGLSGEVRIVNANPVVGGLPTYGWQTDLQIGADGTVVGGNGQLAKPVKGASYPVLSAKQTLDHLNSTSTGSATRGDCPSVGPQQGGGLEKDAEGKRPGGTDQSLPCPPSGGKPDPAEVTGAEFGLSVQFVDGGQALVPSWLFQVRQPGAPGGDDTTNTVTHPAVDPKYIADRGTEPGPAQPPGQPPQGDKGDKGDKEAGTETMTLESYTVRDGGKVLDLHFWGGVCSDYSAAVEQSGTAVTAQVTGKEKEPGGVCIKIAKQFTETVTLKTPLDDREVIDSSNGKMVREKQGK